MARILVTVQVNGDYWQAKWRDRQGKQYSKGLGSRDKYTKRNATAKARKLEADLNSGLERNERAPTLKKYLKRFLAHRDNLAETTKALYIHTGKLLTEFFGDDRKLDDITRVDANDWRNWNASRECRQGKLSENTIRKHNREAKCIFKYAVDEDILSRNPFDKLVGAPVTVDKTWEYIDRPTLRLMMECSPSDGWHILLGLCRLAGLRRGEALNLRWVDVDRDRRRITANATTTQRTTKKRRRELPIDPELYDILFESRMKDDCGELVVPKGSIPVANALRKAVHRICEKADVPIYLKPLHTLRKNCETDWLEKYPVLDVCSWLGHDPSVAAKHYHKTKDEMFAAAAGVSE